MDPELQRRLLFVLHRGLLEARLLSKEGSGEQIFDLTDALEQIPGYLDSWEPAHLESIRFNLKTYAKRHPQSTFNYLRYLEVDPTPNRF